MSVTAPSEDLGSIQKDSHFRKRLTTYTEEGLELDMYLSLQQKSTGSSVSTAHL